MDLFGVKIVNFKRYIESGSVILRVCRLRDLRKLHSLMAADIFPTARSNHRAYSLFSFCRWMRRTFQLIYLIEIEENGTRRIVGFLGLYHMELGRSVTLSLTVFRPEDRRQGYGEKALALILNLLQDNGAAEVVYAEILKSNVPSLRLCRKLGFEVRGFYQDKLLLEKKEEMKSKERQ